MTIPGYVPAPGERDPEKIARAIRNLFENAAGAADLFDGIVPPQGRLTLTDGVPVMSADVTSAATIYYEPYVGSFVPIYDATEGTWSYHDIGDGLSLALDSDTGHVNYQASGFNFDLWAFNDGGTLRLGTGQAWTNDTTRAQAIERVNGLWVNSADMSVVRYGSASGDTAAVAAKEATLLGTMRASADGRCEMTFKPSPAAGGTANKLFLCNAYNRVALGAMCRDSTDSWTYTTDTFRKANNSSSNVITCVLSVPGTAVSASYGINGTHTGTAAGRVGIGYLSDTPDLPVTNTSPSTGIRIYLFARDSRVVQNIGLFDIRALEAAAASGTWTWNGDLGAPHVIQMALIAAIEM